MRLEAVQKEDTRITCYSLVVLLAAVINYFPEYGSQIGRRLFYSLLPLAFRQPSHEPYQPPFGTFTR